MPGSIALRKNMQKRGPRVLFPTALKNSRVIFGHATLRKGKVEKSFPYARRNPRHPHAMEANVVRLEEAAKLHESKQIVRDLHRSKTAWRQLQERLVHEQNANKLMDAAYNAIDGRIQYLRRLSDHNQQAIRQIAQLTFLRKEGEPTLEEYDEKSRKRIHETVDKIHAQNKWITDQLHNITPLYAEISSMWHHERRKEYSLEELRAALREKQREMVIAMYTELPPELS